MRSGRAGPRLFLMLFLRKKQLEKGAKELLAQALRQREALMHDRIRSANLPKLTALPQKAHTHSGFKHMERFPHKPRN